MLRPFTGRRLAPAQLVGAGRPLALVEMRLDPAVAARLADLTDPATLVRYGIRPDVLASRSRVATQAVSRSLFDRGLPGFRWWSALHGDCHAVLLFVERLGPGRMRHGQPEPLTTSHPAVLTAARELGMTGS